MNRIVIFSLCSFLSISSVLSAQPSSSTQPEQLPPTSRVAEAEPSVATPPSSDDARTAAFEFALAKLWVEEGEFRKALEAFDRAIELDPDDAYLRIELADFLSRLGRFTRDRASRSERLQRSAAVADEALLQLPGNPDALRAKANAYLALAEQGPGEATHLTVAREALEQLREAAPGDVRSLFSLGQIYQRSGESAKAAGVFQQIVDVSPSYRPVYRMLADAWFQAGEPERAEEALRAILGFEPEAEAIRATLAEILGDRGDHASAVEVLRGAPGGRPETPEARSRLATELYLSGDFEAALSELQPLVDELADNGYQRWLLGLTYGSLARNDRALEVLEPLYGDNPESLDIALTISNLLLRERRGDEANVVLERLLARVIESGDVEKRVRARLGLIEVRSTLGDWDGLIEAAQELLDDPAAGEAQRRDAQFAMVDALVEKDRADDALNLLGSEVASVETAAKRLEVLARSDRFGSAEELTERLLAAYGSDPEQRMVVIEALHRAERYSVEIPLLEAMEPTLGVQFMLGSAYERSGQFESAAATFEALLDDDPQFAPALNYLAYMWIERGQNLEQALEMTEQAVAIDPSNGAYVDSLGWAYFQLGRFEEARDALERARRLEPDATIYEHLGDVYSALGDEARARKAYRDALMLEADDPDALHRKLAELERDSAFE